MNLGGRHVEGDTKIAGGREVGQIPQFIVYVYDIVKNQENIFNDLQAQQLHKQLAIVGRQK